MLKQRLLTALCLIPLVIGGIFFLPPTLFSAVVAIAIGVAGWELAGLMQLKKTARAAYVALILAISFLIQHTIPAIAVFLVSIIGWIFALFAVIHYNRKPVHTKHFSSLLAKIALGLFLLTPCWLAIITLREFAHGAFFVLFLLILIWGADSGAYFAGSYWGKRKLAAHISPGKSVEGVLGGLVAALFLGIILSMFLPITSSQWLGLMGLILITTLFSVLGDLFESLLKRFAGVKDSGQLLPGHGGMLDRIDSLLAASPVFVFGMIVVGAL